MGETIDFSTPNILARIGTTVSTGIVGGFEALFEKGNKEWGKMLDGVLDRLEQANYISPEMNKAIRHTRDSLGLLGLLYTPIMSVVLTLLPTIVSMSVMLEPLQNGVKAQIRGSVPVGMEVLPAVFRNPDTVPIVREILAKQGYTEKYIDTIFQAAYATVPVAEALELYRRGDITDEQFITRMRENGFTDDRLSS